MTEYFHSRATSHQLNTLILALIQLIGASAVSDQRGAELLKAALLRLGTSDDQTGNAVDSVALNSASAAELH